MATSPTVSWWEVVKDIAAGSIGGMAGKIIDHPFDSIKVKLQHQTTRGAAAAGFSGPWDCFQRTLRYEGYAGLYRGLSIPLFGAIFETAIIFTANGLFRRALIAAGDIAEHEMLPLREVFVSGAAAGAAAALVLTPVELVKCRLQVQTSSATLPLPRSATLAATRAARRAIRAARPHYAGPLDCVRRSVAEEGLAVLFRGHVATTLREIPGTAVWFATYEAVVRATTHARHESPPTAVVIGAGGMAGVASWAAVYPIDTVKTAQQTAPPPARGSAPPGFSATLRAIVRAGGVRALYAGMAPTLLRAFPTNAAVFLLYEQAIAVLGGP